MSSIRSYGPCEPRLPASRPGGIRAGRAAMRTFPLAVLLALAATVNTSQAAQPPAARQPAVRPPAPVLKSSPAELVAIEGRVEVAKAEATTWEPAKAGLGLEFGDRVRTGRASRGTLRLGDLILRMTESTTLQILDPKQKDERPLLNVRSGAVYFFSRERPNSVRFQTPLAAGAIRGTEFNLAVAEDGATRITMLDGVVEFSSEDGQTVVEGGEQGSVVKGSAPERSAVVDALQTIQWCLYYPAVISPDELGMTEAEQASHSASLALYRRGDVVAAVAALLQEPSPTSDATAVYHAALLLFSGNVQDSRQWLRGLGTKSTASDALEQTIAAVQGREWQTESAPDTGSRWLAESYYRQSRANLTGALEAARKATTLSATFGPAWARLGELEFSFGRTRAALAALEKALERAPRDAPSLALKGFVLAAQNHTQDAIDWFNRAIEADSSVGNAWLGRGLCRIRTGQRNAGLEDLLIAAALEPQRALLRSYLGKAFQQDGRAGLAAKELGRAAALDPNDPTSWLYRALLDGERNLINDAVEDLRKSKELNDNRNVYRSRLLLDQDLAVRGANLARFYEDAGLHEVGVREAERAVEADYSNYSAHLFLRETYEAMRDFSFEDVRYDNAANGEALISRILAPVGAGGLSSMVSQQEYSRLLNSDGVGLSSLTRYSSDGGWLEQGTQYGVQGNIEYAIEGSYMLKPGDFPNTASSVWDAALRAKAQVAPEDTLYVGVEAYRIRAGASTRRYDPSLDVSNYQFDDRTMPVAQAGYRHEWSPGNQTLIQVGREESNGGDSGAGNHPFFNFGKGLANPPTFVKDTPASGWQDFELEDNTVELQQIISIPKHTLILGAMYDQGTSHSMTFLQDYPPPGNLTPQWRLRNFYNENTSRASGYVYHQWQIIDSLSLTTGVAYERDRFPRDNIDVIQLPGVLEEEQISPKLGAVWSPWHGGYVRGHYTRGLTGSGFDDYYRLEPTHVGGINQSYREVIPSALLGPLPVQSIDGRAVSLDQEFSSGTYLGSQFEWNSAHVHRNLGVVEGFPTGRVQRIGEMPQEYNYDERSMTLTAHQLLGKCWSLGSVYRLVESRLVWDVAMPPTVTVAPFASLQRHTDTTATLHQLGLSLNYYLPCGVFASFRSQWADQSNRGDITPMPGDTFWQHHVDVGYRFPRRRAEVKLSLLNLTDQDYRLNPATYYVEMPRQRTLAVTVRLDL